LTNGLLNRPDLDLANDLDGVEEAREDAELDRVLGAVGQIGEVEGVVASAFELVLGVVLVAVAPDAVAVSSAFALLGAGDRVQALLNVGDDGHQSGQGLAGPVAFPADVDVNAAARVDPVPPGLKRLQNLGDLGDSLGAAKDRADDLAGVTAFESADGAVAFGGPAWRQVGDLDAVAVVADAQAVCVTALAGAMVSISTPKVSWSASIMVWSLATGVGELMYMRTSVSCAGVPRKARRFGRNSRGILSFLRGGMTTDYREAAGLNPNALSLANARRVRWLRARYDAAATNPDNRRHWANAGGLSANAANSVEVRRILRNRARYEVANNSYARGIVLTLANDVVGTGPRLQLLTADAEANRLIEREFAAWAKAVNLAEKLRTMRMARAQDGEAFAILTNNPKLPTPVQLDLRLVEADRVGTPDLNAAAANAVDGIVFDAAGNPVEYHVLKQHPGDTARQYFLEYDRLPADSVLHWFRADKPGQARGIPDIMPALPLFAQLRRFTLAVIAAAETAADFAGILYTDAPAGGEADAAEPFEPIELEQRALVTMPGGWKMSQLQAEQPSTGYAEFKHEILNEIARCLNMPFNVAAGNSSGYNYASGRLDHQTYFKAIRVKQVHLEAVVLDRILAAWLDEAARLW